MPAEASVTLSEAPKTAAVVLERPGGNVDKLQAQIDGSTITVELPADGPRGKYTLSYRVVSADGHPVSGSTTFTVTTGIEPAATPAPTPTTATPQTGYGFGFPSLDMAGGAALIALAAGLIFWLTRR
jgi:hypothetical protein